MDDEQRIDEAIEARLNKMRETIASETVERERMERLLDGAQQWETVPDDIGDETIIALIALSRSGPFVMMNVSRTFINDINGRVLPEMSQNDPLRYRNIVKQAEKSTPTLKPSELPRVEMIAMPPEQEGGDWILIAVPVTIDEFYQVAVPEIMPVAMQLTLDVFPPDNNDMSAAFNTSASGLFLPAGTPGKYLALTYMPASDGPKMAMLNGHMSAGGHLLSHVFGADPFHVGPEPDELDEDWNFGFPPEMNM